MASSTLPEGGSMAVVRSKEGQAFDAEDLTIEPSYGAVWEGFGVEVHYQAVTLPASREVHVFAVAFYKWLSEGQKLVPNPVRLMPGGLERVVPDGFALLGGDSMTQRELERTESWMKPISAEKLFYRIEP